METNYIEMQLANIKKQICDIVTMCFLNNALNNTIQW